jgi:hypothetical protein
MNFFEVSLLTGIVEKRKFTLQEKILLSVVGSKSQLPRRFARAGALLNRLQKAE